MVKKSSRHILILIAVIAILTLSLGTICANAIEAPIGATEISIPVSLSSSSAIAGGEIEFSKTKGLVYERFEAAAGIQNKVENTVAGKNHIGFYALDNSYVPDGGKVALGRIVFKYTGNDPEAITFNEVRLHTKTAAGVDSKVTKTGTVVNITREQSGSGGGNTSGGDVVSDGIIVSADGSLEDVVIPSAADIAVTTAIGAEAAPEDAVAADAAKVKAANNSSSKSIASDDVPLSSSSGKTSSLSANWWIAIPIVLAVAALIFAWFKRRKKEEEAKKTANL